MTFDITPEQLQQLLQQPISQENPICLIDVREPHEWQTGHLATATHIPLKELPNQLHKLNPHAQTVLYCKAGYRSLQALSILQAAGFTKLHNLQGGILAWHSKIDPNIRVC